MTKTEKQNQYSESEIKKIQKVREWIKEQQIYLEEKYSTQDDESPQGDPLKRMRGMFEVLLTGKPNFQTPLQRPYSFFLPGLPSTPIYDKSMFSFVKILEDSYPLIKQELLSILPSDGKLNASQGFYPYTGDGVNSDKGAFTSSGDWRVFYFYKNFMECPSNCQLCPQTYAVLKSVPEFLRGMVCFSILEPGSSILPHTGPSNMRLTCHLGLIGCKGVKVFVGKEKSFYKDGECIIFDDSYVHSVKHDGKERRVTLMLDFWHPGVTRIERNCFMELLHLAATNLECDLEEFCHSLHLYQIRDSRSPFSEFDDDSSDSEED